MKNPKFQDAHKKADYLAILEHGDSLYFTVMDPRDRGSILLSADELTRLRDFIGDHLSSTGKKDRALPSYEIGGANPDWPKS